MGAIFYDKLNLLLFFLNSCVPLMVGRFPKRKYNEIFFTFVYYFHVLGIFLWGYFFFKPKFIFLPPFLFYIPLNIKFGYGTTIKMLPKIYNLFTIFSHIVLEIYVCTVCNYS